jgi:hypothetical protein
MRCGPSVDEGTLAALLESARAFVNRAQPALEGKVQEHLAAVVGGQHRTRRTGCA